MQEAPFRVPVRGGELHGHYGGDGARVDTIPHCGHFPWLERPGELRRHVESFLSS